ncbi:hypothetical protein ACEWY4_010134 [Coilia grayii]|uniref:Ig-like domain-containing protein n=1 Tax=Coilia grayii TaxID=363190 RepID=A0ABD1K8E1_9TELE
MRWSKRGNTICEYYLENMRIKLINCAAPFIPSLQGLNITSFERSHSGFYNCTIEKLIPPPHQIVINTTMELRKEAVDIQQENTSHSGCVQLWCTLDDINQEQVDFIWLSRSYNRFKQVKVTNSSSSVNSSLSLCGSEWEDGDTITCSVSLRSGNFSSNWIIRGKGPVQIGSNSWLVKIICICAGTGTVLILTIAVIVYKCTKRKRDDSIVYTNKVYENFNFGTGISNRQTRPETQIQTQHEHCIYEN